MKALRQAWFDGQLLLHPKESAEEPQHRRKGPVSISAMAAMRPRRADQRERPFMELRQPDALNDDVGTAAVGQGFYPLGQTFPVGDDIVGA